MAGKTRVPITQGGHMAKIYRLESRPGVCSGYFIHTGPRMLGIWRPGGGGRLVGVDWRQVAGPHQLKAAGLARPGAAERQSSQGLPPRPKTGLERQRELERQMERALLSREAFSRLPMWALPYCRCRSVHIRTASGFVPGIGLRYTYGCRSCGKVWRRQYT